jgi:tRNA-binding EMAP/Myf-like protein
MFERIKYKIGSFVLNKELEKQSRDVEAKNLKDIKSVGMVFNADDEKTFRTIKTYVRTLKEGGVKNVKVIGFVNDKIIPFYLQPSIEFDFITTQNVNWYGKPICVEVANFKDENFDILIDFSNYNNLTTKFIFGLSKSKLKIGRSHVGSEKFYDLMLTIDESRNLNYYIEQINHYLSIIHKPSEYAHTN